MELENYMTNNKPPTDPPCLVLELLDSVAEHPYYFHEKEAFEDLPEHAKSSFSTCMA